LRGGSREVREVFGRGAEARCEAGFELRGRHESQWAAVVSVAGKIGTTPQTLLNWVRQHERDIGQREGVTTAEAVRVKELERWVRELRRADEICATLQIAPSGRRRCVACERNPALR